MPAVDFSLMIGRTSLSLAMSELHSLRDQVRHDGVDTAHVDGLDALGGQRQRDVAAQGGDPVGLLLDVRVEPALGATVRVGDAVAESRPSPGYLAVSCHDHSSWQVVVKGRAEPAWRRAADLSADTCCEPRPGCGHRTLTATSRKGGPGWVRANRSSLWDRWCGR
ncbi:hypothetical protein STAWA0001_0343 [Staphylococcus warneri L37603]|nr:hypothetical protein STAWA0001_0343 [Staphylococcus warneri L37603]